MPELPEVETVARGLRAPLIGRSIVSVTVSWPRTIARPDVDEFVSRIVGCRVVSVDRRGKYIVITLNQGHILIHLKMSGRLLVLSAGIPPDPHVRLCFRLDDGRQLHFRDVRKFGRVYWVDDPAQVTAGLGPEPLSADFTLDQFRRLLARRSGRLKSLLLNQEFVAGLGNIYADEALFSARLHPLRRADSLTPEEQESLHGAIRSVLGQAVLSRGTTLNDGGYVDADGQPGGFQGRIAVYGRGGELCLRCQTPVERIVVGGRSTHFCPSCQPAGVTSAPDDGTQEKREEK